MRVDGRGSMGINTTVAADGISLMGVKRPVAVVCVRGEQGTPVMGVSIPLAPPHPERLGRGSSALMGSTLSLAALCVLSGHDCDGLQQKYGLAHAYAAFSLLLPDASCMNRSTRSLGRVPTV